MAFVGSEILNTIAEGVAEKARGQHAFKLMTCRGMRGNSFATSGTTRKRGNDSTYDQTTE